MQVYKRFIRRAYDLLLGKANNNFDCSIFCLLSKSFEW